jgi:DNA replication and repair protein RecF
MIRGKNNRTRGSSIPSKRTNEEYALYLTDIKLYSFRNLADGEIYFHPGINLIEGENGQGKSNLIEAIHVLSASKTFRPCKQRDLAEWEKEEFSVFGKVSSDVEALRESSQVRLGISYEDGTKRVFVNGEQTRKVGEYVRHCPAVTFAPKDIDLIYGSPAVRRTFIDRYVSILSSTALAALTSYQKVIRAKNSLLKERFPNLGQLRTMNEMVAQYAAIITRERSALIERLIPLIEEFYAQFAQQDGTVRLGLIESFLDQAVGVRSEAAYAPVLERLLQSEIERRTTLIGPHLDDLYFELNGRSARQFASQGQARSLVLALLLSILRVIEERIHVAPLLLLDDFSSELDEGRMRRFFELLRKNKYQVFITGTDLSAHELTDQETTLFRVCKGRVERVYAR